MIDWSKGFSSRYILTTLDKNSFADLREYELVDGKIDADNDTSLIQSASFSMTEKIGTGESWIRIYLLAHQNGASAKVPLFTGIAVSPERKLEGRYNKYDVKAYSVLKPASDVVLPIGYYVPRYSDAKKVKDLLACCRCNIIVYPDSPKLSSDIVANDGDTNLDMALRIIDALNWRIKIGGDGTVYVLPYSKSPVVTFSANENDVIETSVTDKYDWYDCPNIYYAVSENGSAIARDDDPGSVLSTVSRGREVWKYDDDVNLSNDENIVEYARRMLKESQKPIRTISYERRFFDGVQTSDVIRLNYTGHDLSGTYIISSQAITLGHACSVSEEVQSLE